MIVQCVSQVRCDGCPATCSVTHGRSFAESLSRLGWGLSSGGHLCPKCFKKAVAKSRLNPEPLPPLVNGYRILTVPPQP